MDSLILRCIRSVAVAAVMFFSLALLGLSRTECLLGALLPLLLGCIDVMLSFSYFLTGCIFAIAIFVHILFPIVKDTKIFNDVRSEFHNL